MLTENEVRILEINTKEIIKLLNHLGAQKLGEYFQRRYTYDFNPKQENKWIRLRTNGINTTLTIKEVKNKTISGTKELEIIVNDFDKTNLLLEQLGYKHKNYQENKRIIYFLDNVEISLDSWPLIPPYMELEGKKVEDINNLIKKLNLKNEITTLDVESIFKTKYSIDILNIKELKFK